VGERHVAGSISDSAKPLVWGGLIGPVMFVAVFLVLGAIRPGYEPLRHQVSYLSLGDGGWIQTASFIITGVLVLAFAVGLRHVLAGGVGSVVTTVAVGVAGAGLLIAGVFPTMPAFGFPPGTPNAFPKDIPPSAYVHVVGAVAFFGGLIAAPLVMARRFRRTGERGWAAISILSAGAVFVFFAGSSADPSGQPFAPAWAGLLQRLAIVAGLGWMAVIAASVLRGRSW
jgi:hypothetical protein